MLDVNLIRNNAELVREALKKRGFEADFTRFFALDARKKALLLEVETLKAKRNRVSAQVPAKKKAGEDVEGIFAEMREIGEKISEGDAEIAKVTAELNAFLLSLPNMPDSDVVAGGKENNEVLSVVGKKPEFSFEAQNHVDLCTRLGMIDYDRGVKLSGGGYWLYRGKGAILEWALLNFFVEQHLKDGYEFILPPHQLGYNCGLGSGQFPKFLDEVYWMEGEDKTKGHFMLPTAETALVNLYANEIIPEASLPFKFFAYTPCYRKEAGSYRAEERGMIRGHQFNKVEMIQITTPEQSKAAFEELLGKAARLVSELGLHYRISKLAAADCSASMARTYDIEIWIPSMGIFKEVSSVSNANDYQARRSGTKYRQATGKTAFVHTLNASGLATSRIMPAIAEQYQNADGSITVPEVLRKFTGFDVIKG